MPSVKRHGDMTMTEFEKALIERLDAIVAEMKSPSGRGARQTRRDTYATMWACYPRQRCASEGFSCKREATGHVPLA